MDNGQQAASFATLASWCESDSHLIPTSVRETVAKDTTKQALKPALFRSTSPSRNRVSARASRVDETRNERDAVKPSSSNCSPTRPQDAHFLGIGDLSDPTHLKRNTSLPTTGSTSTAGEASDEATFEVDRLSWKELKHRTSVRTVPEYYEGYSPERRQPSVSQAAAKFLTELVVNTFSYAGALSGSMTGILIALLELGMVSFQAFKDYSSTLLTCLGSSFSQRISSVVSGGYAAAGVVSGIFIGSIALINNASADLSNVMRFPVKVLSTLSARVITLDAPVHNGSDSKRPVRTAITPIVANAQATPVSRQPVQTEQSLSCYGKGCASEPVEPKRFSG